MRIVVSGVAALLPQGASPNYLFPSPPHDEQDDAETGSGELHNSPVGRDGKENGRSTVPSLLTQVPASLQATVHVAGRLPADLTSGAAIRREFHVPQRVIDCLDSTSRLAMHAGLKALQEAGCLTHPPRPATPTTPVTPTTPTPPTPSSMGEEEPARLEASLRASTGVVFASSFPTLEASTPSSESEGDGTPTKYDRKWLFRQLVLANAQLAEMIQARGPNLQVSATCAGTSAAITVAHDWLRLGRCERVVVLAADNVTSDALISRVSQAFTSCGVTCQEKDPQTASNRAAFSTHRSGMILGAGAVGMVFETREAYEARRTALLPVQLSSFGHGYSGATAKAELVGTHLCNSAYHGCAMDATHLGEQLALFLRRVLREESGGPDGAAKLLSLDDFCREAIYMAHETGTKGAKGCAVAEMTMLAHALGKTNKERLLIVGTKAVTGHAMGASFEDVAAVMCLASARLPASLSLPGANGVSDLAEDDLDVEALGKLQLARGGGRHTRTYVLHLAAGFGSQVVFLLYRKCTP